MHEVRRVMGAQCAAVMVTNRCSGCSGCGDWMDRALRIRTLMIRGWGDPTAALEQGDRRYPRHRE